MPWVVDTCILLDIGLDDPNFASDSEELLEAKLPDGLLICPVMFVELAPAFDGKQQWYASSVFPLPWPQSQTITHALPVLFDFQFFSVSAFCFQTAHQFECPLSKDFLFLKRS